MAESSAEEVDDAARRLHFGRLLSDALRARGMRQDDLAGILGTTQSSVSGWINGRYEPAAPTVFTVERCLGMDPGSLSRPLGYLPVEPATRSVSVESAIAQSVQLDDEEKAALSAVYRVMARRRSRATSGAGGDRSSTPRAATATANASRPRSVSGGR
jgi:transcriptional regulator with XRE-family HTH domain